MKDSVPATHDINRVMEGVVMDLKRIPAVLLKRLEVHYDDGEVAEIAAEQLAETLKQVEDEGVVFAIQADLDLDLLDATVDAISQRVAAMTQAAVAKYMTDPRETGL